MKKFNPQLIFFIFTLLPGFLSSCRPEKTSGFLAADQFEISDSLSVFIFLDTDCPICQKLQGSFKNKSRARVSQFYVFPGQQHESAISEFIAYDSILPQQVILDPQTILTKTLKAVVTPQAVVCFQKKIRYSGLINDQFLELGAFKTKATVNYVDNALNSLLKNEEIRVANTKAVGCLIESD